MCVFVCVIFPWYFCLQSGMLIVWRSDSRGRLGHEPVQHHLQEPLSQIVFRPPPPQDPSMCVHLACMVCILCNWKRIKVKKKNLQFERLI
jgi:hypothetical protein